MDNLNKLTNNLPKKSLAIFSLTSCEGCEFEFLSFYEHFEKLLHFFDVKQFRLGQEDMLPGPFDVAVIEGSPEFEHQFKKLRDIRKNAKTVVIIGSCAHLGGIQSQRNRAHPHLSRLKVQTVSDIIKVDAVVPGCPVSHTELYRALMDIYWGKQFTLPDLAVCFECRKNENKCLIKNGSPCLGPITRAGCNSVCINGGEACLGCRGPIDQANFKKLREILGTIMEEQEIENWLTIYGDLEANYKNQAPNNK